MDFYDTTSITTTTKSIQTKQTKQTKQTNLKETKQTSTQNKSFLSKLFLSKEIFKFINSFLDKSSQIQLKSFAQKNFSIKERKKQIKETIKKYVLDLGKHDSQVKYRISEDFLVITTSVFNLNKPFLESMTRISYKNENFLMKKQELTQYLKLLNKPFLQFNNGNETVKACKAMLGLEETERIDEEDEFDDEENEKYSVFFSENELKMKIDEMKLGSTKEDLIEKQRKVLELMKETKKKTEEDCFFYPFKFICSVNFWGIILCQGGYFSCGFFLKDKLMEHKSDHKYVVRKKAGKRQIVKDNSKASKNSVGAQLRREGEKKHQENIELILKVNEAYLQKADCIFLFAPGLNKKILVGSNEKTLFSFRAKILNVPFNVSRANYSHMIEIYDKLTTCVVEVPV